mgnify:FL=1
MKNITEDGDGGSVVLPLVGSPAGSQEKADEAKITVGYVVNHVRDFVMGLGLPGLLVYNGARSGAIGLAAGFIYEGGTFDKVAVGAAAGGLNLIASQTFWAAMAIAGAKVGGRVFRKKKHLRVVS